MYAALPSSRVNSSALLRCKHDRVTREAGRVSLLGRDRGGGGIEWRFTCTCVSQPTEPPRQVGAGGTFT